ANEINTTIDQKFLPAPTPPDVPKSSRQWNRMKNVWMAALEDKAFAGWPAKADKAPRLNHMLTVDLDGGSELEIKEFSPQSEIVLRTWTLRKKGTNPERVVI